MRGLKKFNTIDDYNEFVEGGTITRPNVSYILTDDLVIYNPLQLDKLPLYIEAIDNLEVSFAQNNIEYSLDNFNWNTLSANTYSPTIKAGDKIYFKAEGLTSTSSIGIGSFKTTGRYKVGGNIMSMLYGEDFIDKVMLSQNYCFTNMFRNSETLIEAKNLVLPATTLSGYCYYNMFRNCPNLINVPALPAINLATYCYASMFNGCSSLKAVPVLNATKMISWCYGAMFFGCTNIKTAPELPALELAERCYSSMFEGCTSLTKSPTLKAKQLEAQCMNNMFRDCSNISYIKALFETPPSDTYTELWVRNVSSNGTFVKSINATWNVIGESGIPDNWTIEYVNE